VSVTPRLEAFLASVAYLALTLVYTWPLALGLTHDVPGDFGDPLLNIWTIAWDLTHAGRGWWTANIFFPHPLTLAYSEHLFGVALQALPVYAVTRNPILAYNVVLLATFVVSGLGMFLLARELTGSASAAFVAGTAFAFAPYRIASLPHLQVLASAFMPLTLFGFRRYFATGRRRPLAGGAAAWLLQNLSCGYYLLFFSVVVVFYLLWEVTTRRLWTNRVVMLDVIAAGAVVSVATVPFLLPYVTVRRLGVRVRDLVEVQHYSADVWAYVTADPKLRIWGALLPGWSKPEGALFPGLVVVLLSGVGIGRAWREARLATDRRALVRILFALAIGASSVALMLLGGWRLRLPGLSITSFPRAVSYLAALIVMLLMASRNARATARRFLGSPVAIFALIAAFAILMSFGPVIEARGRTVTATSIYGWFYQFVPGFDGVRVPARFAMIAVCAVSVMAAFGTAAVAGRPRRALAVAAVCAILLESAAWPLPMNVNDVTYKTPGLAPLPDSLFPEPPVYDFVATLPPDSALVELPLGETAFDVRYMFYSTRHWRPLVNGYSGSVPQDYAFLSVALEDALHAPDRAWRLLVESRATHAIVHEAYYAGDRGARISALLRERGARDVASFGSDHVFELTPAARK
jgi:hypothetical protein